MQQHPVNESKCSLAADKKNISDISPFSKSPSTNPLGSTTVVSNKSNEHKVNSNADWTARSVDYEIDDDGENDIPMMKTNLLTKTHTKNVPMERNKPTSQIFERYALSAVNSSSSEADDKSVVSTLRRKRLQMYMAKSKKKEPITFFVVRGLLPS